MAHEMRSRRVVSTSSCFRPALLQMVEFRAAIIFRVSAKRRNPTFLLHSVQSGKERTWLNNKSAACGLLDSARDSQSVHLACNKGLQNQQVQGSLQNCCRLRAQDTSPIGIL